MWQQIVPFTSLPKYFTLPEKDSFVLIGASSDCITCRVTGQGHNSKHISASGQECIQTVALTERSFIW